MTTLKHKSDISKKDLAPIASSLNTLLASYQVFYQNLRGFHWNVTGKNFFELHVKYEEWYNDAALKIDEIAERILSIGQRPLHTYSSYISHSKIQEVDGILPDQDVMTCLRDSLVQLITLEREIVAEASEADDEGTVTLVGDYIEQQEKTLWMVNAWLS